MLRTLDEGSHVGPSHMTVRQWLVAWLDAARAEASPNSHERLSETAENFLMPALGNLPLTRLAPNQTDAAQRLDTAF